MQRQFVPFPARPDYLLANAAAPGLRISETYYPGGLHLPRHVHKNPSITINLRGALQEIYGGRSVSLDEPFTMLVRPPCEQHEDRISPAGVRNLEIELTAGSEPGAACGPVLERVSQLRHARLPFLAQQIHEELSVSDTAQPMILQGLVFELLGTALRLQLGGRRGRILPAWLCRVREQLEDRFRESLRIGELARDAGVHPVYLARLFRAYFGASPGQYLRRVRIEWAARELQSPTLRLLSEIALEAGFADQSHFTRYFRRFTGVTPRQYRRQK